jgi:hypothetical protein
MPADGTAQRGLQPDEKVLLAGCGLLSLIPASQGNFRVAALFAGAPFISAFLTMWVIYPALLSIKDRCSGEST